jgi:transcriptional regulator with GAF, ATPase, and Fis domain
MKNGERYRLAIISFFCLLIVSVLLLLTELWNNLSLNPSIHTSNRLYLLVFLILIFASGMFILHLLEEREIRHIQDVDTKDEEDAEPKVEESEEEDYKTPYEVDIDELAEEIIPKFDRSESLEVYAEKILLNIARQFKYVQGVLYLKNNRSKLFESICTYAYTAEKDPAPFKEGEGLVGQAVKNRKLLNLTSLPEGYIVVQSGLGKLLPDNLVIIPLMLNRETIGVIELASFHPLDGQLEWTLRNLAKIIGNALVTKIKAAGKK